MSNPGQPKIADALKDQQPKMDGGEGHSVHPEHAPEQFDPAAARAHNREVNEGIKSNKDRLVDIGRGEQTAGRHPAS